MEGAFAPEKEVPAFSETDRRKAERLLQRLHPDYLVMEDHSEQTEEAFYSQLELEFQQAAEKNRTEDRLSMEEASVSEGELNLLTVSVLPGSRIPVFGKIICIFKRLSRKLLFWYLQPVFERQSWLNRIMMNAVSEQRQALQEVRSELTRSMTEHMEVDVDDQGHLS